MEKKVDYLVTSNPNEATTDSDGLIHLSEFLNGSDPASDATDGDGIDDDVEVENGYNVTGVEGTPPAITNVKNTVEVGYSCLGWVCIPTSANVKVEFDITDNVGVDRIVAKVFRFSGLIAETRTVQLAAGP